MQLRVVEGACETEWRKWKGYFRFDWGRHILRGAGNSQSGLCIGYGSDGGSVSG